MSGAQLTPSVERPDDPDDARIMLGVLQAVEAGEVRSQRHLAAELGIALGLANAYVKRCIRKGLLKVSEVPARRYAYYLTPQGFAEKSRLTAEYLSYSFGFFRQARADCASVFVLAKAKGWRKVALIGVSEVAEVAALCALDADVKVVAVVDATVTEPRFVGLPVAARLDAAEVDGAIICTIRDTGAAIDWAVALLGEERVLVPRLLSRKPLEARGE